MAKKRAWRNNLVKPRVMTTITKQYVVFIGNIPCANHGPCHQVRWSNLFRSLGEGDEGLQTSLFSVFFYECGCSSLPRCFPGHLLCDGLSSSYRRTSASWCQHQPPDKYLISGCVWDGVISMWGEVVVTWPVHTTTSNCLQVYILVRKVKCLSGSCLMICVPLSLL